ncbi:MAG: hypothetical protein AB1611_14255 [bacterium]
MMNLESGVITPKGASGLYPKTGWGREVKTMCYTCGCGKLSDNMGDSRNITAKDFENAAQAAKESVEQAKRNTLESLKKELGEK